MKSITDKEEDLSRFNEARILDRRGVPAFLELQGRSYTCLTDLQGSIRGLVDCVSLTGSYAYASFGSLQNCEETVFNPWRYAAKRFDPDIGLLFFGSRFYDPDIGRWMTTDPAGFIDSINLYQYLFNNPFRYRDPDGRFAIAIPLLVFGAELAFPTIATIGSAVTYSIIGSAVAYGCYRTVEYLNKPVYEDNFLDYLLNTVDTDTEKKKPSL